MIITDQLELTLRNQGAYASAWVDLTKSSINTISAYCQHSV